MGKDYLVVPDPHAHPNFNNDRADWLGKFILDHKPDVVVNMGDTWDLPSLSSFDKGKASFSSASYERDIDAGLDFQDRSGTLLRRLRRSSHVRYSLRVTMSIVSIRCLSMNLTWLEIGMALATRTYS